MQRPRVGPHDRSGDEVLFMTALLVLETKAAELLKTETMADLLDFVLHDGVRKGLDVAALVQTVVERICSGKGGPRHTPRAPRLTAASAGLGDRVTALRAYHQKKVCEENVTVRRAASALAADAPLTRCRRARWTALWQPASRASSGWRTRPRFRCGCRAGGRAGPACAHHRSRTHAHAAARAAPVEELPAAHAVGEPADLGHPRRGWLPRGAGPRAARRGCGLPHPHPPPGAPRRCATPCTTAPPWSGVTAA
jgi:hypothetical protein